MKKILLTGGLLSLFGLSLTGQNARTHEQHHIQVNTNALPASEVYNNKLNSTTCDSIYTAPWANPSTSITIGTALSDTATPGCSPKAGYVNGTNCYGDKEKANFNTGSLYGSLSNASVTAVSVLLYRDVAANAGTQGGSGASVGVKLYGGNNTTGPSGSALVTKSDPMSTVLASHVNTSVDFFWHKITLLTPVQVPSSGFFASIVIPMGTTPGDTAAIAEQYSVTAANNVAWELWSDNSWHKYNTPGTWQYNANLVIVPYYCFSTSGVGLSKNLGIEESVQVFPNPTNGSLKLQTAFNTVENVTITITNALGQQIKSLNKLTMVEIIDVDLSAQPDGVYFVTVSNGKDKMVQRIILNK